MAIYKCSWEVEPGTTRIKFNEWSERVLNPGSPDLKASALTTGSLHAQPAIWEKLLSNVSHGHVDLMDVIKEGVDVEQFLTHFKGDFIGFLSGLWYIHQQEFPLLLLSSLVWTCRRSIAVLWPLNLRQVASLIRSKSLPWSDSCQVSSPLFHRQSPCPPLPPRISLNFLLVRIRQAELWFTPKHVTGKFVNAPAVWRPVPWTPLSGSCMPFIRG